jgi:hypothetical protein
MKMIIPEDSLAAFKKEAEKLTQQLKKLEGTWIEKNGIIREIVIAYYERKFLKAVKRLSNGIKYS